MNEMISVKLYMGRAFGAGTGRGEGVTDQMMDTFIDDHVVTHLEGFTLTDGTGYWNSQREKVTILEIIVSLNCLQTDSDGNRCAPLSALHIRDLYVAMFDQESVMVTLSPALVSF